ncbi:hypothetical protein [Ascidiimonas aurantiaca]|uniref:hypothetical protein n=1 Tax=Ascidiimonas aurantiaca TaxID=1685432 RepID=UPI0030EF388F
MLKEASIHVIAFNQKKELRKTLVFLKEVLGWVKTEVFEIQCSNYIKVYHRINQIHKKQKGENCFRLAKKLKNASFYYLIYDPFLFRVCKIVKLYFDNFTKYRVTDIRYMKGMGKAVMRVCISSFNFIQRENPGTKHYKKIKTLPMPVIGLRRICKSI